MARTTLNFCDGCEHLAENLRTDFNPATPEFFCGHPCFLPLDSNQPGPWLGFIAVQHDDCIALGARSVPNH